MEFRQKRRDYPPARPSCGINLAGGRSVAGNHPLGAGTYVPAHWSDYRIDNKMGVAGTEVYLYRIK
jgi:hypothetical protein